MILEIIRKHKIVLLYIPREVIIPAILAVIALSPFSGNYLLSKDIPVWIVRHANNLGHSTRFKIFNNLSFSSGEYASASTSKGRRV